MSDQYELLLEAIAERHDLDLDVGPSFIHGYSAQIAAPGKWILKTTGAESVAEAAEALYVALLERHRRLPGCDECLGATRVPSGDYPGRNAGCGHCQGGCGLDFSFFHPSDAATREAAGRELK